MVKKEKSKFGIMDVARLVGIQPTLLNKFIQRGKYGIRASVRAGEGHGRQRFFGEADLYGIALVYWLFESGLRSETIQYVLNQICGGRLRSRANDAASNVPRQTNQMLVITRTARTGFAKYPMQEATFMDAEFISAIVSENQIGLIVIIPVGRLYAFLREAMETK